MTAGVGVIAILARGKLRPLALFHILAGFWVIWVGLTSAWSIDPQVSIMHFKVAVQVVAIPWLIWELASSPKQRSGLFQAFVLGAYVSVFNILANYNAGIAVTGQRQLTTAATGRFTAEGFNPNEIGFLLLLALPMAWQLSLEHRNPIVRWINRLYLPLGCVAILLTGSRSSLLGALLALSIVPLSLGRLSLGMKFGVAALIAATLTAGTMVVPEKTVARLATTTDELESGTLNERRIIWRAGVDVFLRHPVGGVGAGAFPQAVKPFLGYKKTAHNTFVSILVEEGVIGLALFCLILVSVYFHARAAPPDERRFVLILLLSVFIGLLPRGAEFNKPMWLILGLLLAPVASTLVHRARTWVPAVPRAAPPQAAVRRTTGRLR